MTPSIDEREQHILNLAGSLLPRPGNGDEPDEARVDAEFLFRFESGWCKWVSHIRTMMRALIGQSGDAPLSNVDAARWLLHLDENVGLAIGIESGDGNTRYTIENSRGSYSILDEGLEERQRAISERLLATLEDRDENRHEWEQIWQQMWMEANQTSKIQSELARLTRAYNLVPDNHELGDYPPNQVKQQYRSVINWVLQGLCVPSFFYDKTMLLESEVKNIGGRDIRPWEWPKKQSFSKERLPLTTRIRTWAIDYLTQRGGGTLEQLAAIELWNARFPKLKVNPAQYEDNRTKLFAWGTGKGLSPSIAASFKNVRKRWALLVGINEYDDCTMFGPLHVCVKDVEAISQRLVSGGFDQDGMHLVTDSSGALPTRLKILQTLKTIADATEPDDLLFFYFSGHGIEENEESYLVSKDANHVVMRDSAVPVSRVKEIMMEAPARAKVIILDACHSGARIGGKGDKRMSEAFAHHVFGEAEGITILSSCKQGEVSYELPTGDNSVFTHFLLKALEGESDRDRKGFVTVQDVNLYILDKVKQWAAKNEHTQTPTLQAATVGDIPLARYQ